jgi:hypothetical protein
MGGGGENVWFKVRLVADCCEHVKPNSVAMTGRELLVLCGNYKL